MNAMPSKKRKYNARFPAGRIKKIMQTDEEVGKVAQAVPIIISRTLELFVESLLNKALQVTTARNAKTLSPSHVKHCILAESKFDFLRDLVKNIPDVSAAEEKEMMSPENSPNSSSFSDASVPPRRLLREDSNSSNSSDWRIQQLTSATQTRVLVPEAEVARPHRTETVTSTNVPADGVIDLSRTKINEAPPRANFYKETLQDDLPQRSVITVNPKYATPQPSTSTYSKLPPVPPLKRIEIPVPKMPEKPMLQIDLVSLASAPTTPAKLNPTTPILNIDYSKNLSQPEIKYNIILGNAPVPSPSANRTQSRVTVQRQNSKLKTTPEVKKIEVMPSVSTPPVDIDHFNSGNLQIDEDYDT